MGRLILPALVAFLLGLSGTTALAVVHAKNAAAAPVAVAAADSTHRDSASAAHDAAAPLDSAAIARAALAQLHGVPAESLAAHDSTRTVAPGADVHAPPARRNVAGVGAVPSPIGADSAHVPHVRPVAAAAPAVAPVQERRLAKIFGAMQTKDAARVLMQMGDDDVQTILGYLGDRQAAAILASFPPQRAALIGRSSMRPTSRPIAPTATAPVASRTGASGEDR